MTEARPTVPFERVTILGLGVMGGSLARALGAVGDPPRRTGWSPDREERARALEAGALEAAPDTWEEAVGGADLVVLATPLSAVCTLVGPVAAAAPEACVIGDLASLKEPVRRVALAAGLHGRWVGCHPMCGSEGSGFAASRSDLYRGARVWTVAEEEAVSSGVVARVDALWRALRAIPRGVPAADHDRSMALASHLPQLATNALACTLRGLGVSVSDLGTGGRDATRLAGSAPSMWTDLLAHAHPELVDALRALGARAHELADLLGEGDVDAIGTWMARDRAWREGA